TTAQHAAQPAKAGQGLSHRRRRTAEPPRTLSDLSTEVAHTDTEVRQTLGVVEKTRIGAVSVKQRTKGSWGGRLSGQQVPVLMVHWFGRRVRRGLGGGLCQGSQRAGG